MNTEAATEFVYRPFLTPLPVWESWLWLLPPLCVGAAVVWKCTRVASLATLPRESLVLTIKILLGYLAASAALWLIVNVIRPALHG